MYKIMRSRIPHLKRIIDSVKPDKQCISDRFNVESGIMYAGVTKHGKLLTVAIYEDGICTVRMETYENNQNRMKLSYEDDIVTLSNYCQSIRLLAVDDLETEDLYSEDDI